MSDQVPFVDVEFMENPEPRCPCVLLLDVSYSMSGEPISRLNQAVELFSRELLDDPLASKRVELAIVTFGTEVRPAQEFISPRNFIPTPFQANGATPMAEAVVKGARLLEARKEEYRKAGVQYFRPWMFIITDGEPTDEYSNYWKEAIQIVHSGERNKHLLFFGVAVNDANQTKLDQICPPNRPSLKLKGMSFNELFSWLSSSLRTVSCANPGSNEISLPSPEGWMSIDV